MNCGTTWRWTALTCCLLGGACATTEQPAHMLASQGTWERTHFACGGIEVDVFVPAGGRAPLAPPTDLSSAKSGYLSNRQYGWTRDYAPRFWLVALCMKRIVSAGTPLTAEALNADWVAIDKQYAADLGIKKGTVGMRPLHWEPVVLGQRTWFTDPALATNLYVTTLSPATLLAVSDVSYEDRETRSRADYRKVVEQVASRVVFAASLRPAPTDP